ncbi:MAG TPA: hypothetical protein VHI71_04235 [Actinomycetota bacterium]|nr:hypothetical protein [Actinomycetota bacterium]
MKAPLLWRLAPGVLLRFPRSAAAIAFAAGVVVLATILGPVFLESSERAAMAGEMERTGRWEAGLQIVWRPFEYATTPEARARLLRLGQEGLRALHERMEDVPGVGPATVTFLGGQITAAGEEGNAFVRLAHRTHDRENVRVLDGGDEEGVWIADVSAEAMGVEPGDSIDLVTGGARVEVPVGAIYRFLPDDEPREFWTPLRDFVYKLPSADTYPPPLVLADAELVTSTDIATQVRWNVPLEAGTLAPDAVRAVGREFRALGRETLRQSEGFGKVLSDLGGPAYLPEVDTLLGGVIRVAQDRLDASQAPTGVVTAAAKLLGAGLMVAGGLSLVARRRSEVRALIARGASPLSLALRFAVESAAPVATGAVVAVVAGYAVVRMLGAAGGVEWSFVVALAGDVAVSAVGAIALFALAAGAAVSREERSFRARSTAAKRLATLGAGGAVVAGGALAYRSLEAISVTGSDDALGGSILLAPIAVIAAASLVAGVALRLVLPIVATRARGRSTGTFLAAKRLGASSGMTHTLVVVCGTALGVTFFGLTVSRSVHETATAKAKTFVGSDVAAGVAPNPPPLPDDLGFPATRVTSILTYVEGAGQALTVLGVEPETFASAAYWDDDFADEPLPELLSRLEDADEGPITAIAVGFDPGEIPAISGLEVPLDVVGEAGAWPGMTSGQPLVAMTLDSAGRLLRSGGSGTRSELIWAKGDAEEVEKELIAAGQAAFEPITAEAVLARPTLQSLVWSLGLLGAVGALASATAVAGLSLYLQARHTAARVAAAITRRMGLRRRTELLSWVAEIGGAGAASLAVGAATGLLTASLIHERLDTQPDLSPAPILVVPATLPILAVVAVAAVTALTARRLQRRMDSAPVGEIMRV